MRLFFEGGLSMVGAVSASWKHVVTVPEINRSLATVDDSRPELQWDNA